MEPDPCALPAMSESASKYENELQPDTGAGRGQGPLQRPCKSGELVPQNGDFDIGVWDGGERHRKHRLVSILPQ